MVTASANSTTHSPEETRSLGRSLGGLLPQGSFVALIGGLGSGKTVMIQGAAEGLGFDGIVASPSFIIVNEYQGRMVIRHVDLYRIEGADALHELGYREFYFGGGVTFVEWADRVPELLPAERLEVRIAIATETTRDVSLTAFGDEYGALLGKLVASWTGDGVESTDD